MNIKAILLTVIIGAAAFTAIGQQRKGEPGDGPKELPARSKSAPAREIGANTAIEAVLTESLDVRRAKTGDEVALKTTKSVKQNGEVTIPKGTRLIGRVTEVKQRGEGSAASVIGLAIDRMERNGTVTPITATVLAITNARANAIASDTGMADISGSGSARGSASASRPAGGGLLGGVANTAGGLLSGATQTVGSVTGSTVGTAGQTLGSVGNAIPGLQISGNAEGSGGATLSSTSRNLKLEKGVTFSLLLNASDK